MYEVYATDKDEGLNGAVRYSFLKTAGNRDWEFFTIDPLSGLIQTAQRLDRETQAVYSVRAGPGARGGAWGGAFFWALVLLLASWKVSRGPGHREVPKPTPSPSLFL